MSDINYMSELLLLVFVATIAGLISGVLPGIGSSALILASLPLLFALPPELCLVYYAVAIQASQFSGSVVALNFGLLGELTSYPALMERDHIVNNGLQRVALKFTAIGSVVACTISVILLFPLMEWFQQNSFIMRTDFIFLIACLIVLFCLTYKKNSKATNITLTMCGIIMSQVGYHGEGSAAREFLTFGQPFLYAGIPFIAVLAGLIAVPLIIAHHRDLKVKISECSMPKQQVDNKLPIFSILRGTGLGLVAGLLPVIGTQISSYLAWYSEKKFYAGNNNNSVLQRLTAAESANNSSAIAVMIPLLMLGIAIIPSEMILLSVIQIKSWMPGQEYMMIGNFGFYQYLTLAVMGGAGISYLLCYSFLNLVHRWISKNINILNLVALVVLTLSVLYVGSLVEARLFFISCFLILSCVALIFKKTDFIPLVAGYFVGDLLVNSAMVMNFLYFSRSYV